MQNKIKRRVTGLNAGDRTQLENESKVLTQRMRSTDSQVRRAEPTITGAVSAQCAR